MLRLEAVGLRWQFACLGHLVKNTGLLLGLGCCRRNDALGWYRWWWKAGANGCRQDAHCICRAPGGRLLSREELVVGLHVDLTVEAVSERS